MFFENPTDLIVGCESAFSCGLQAAINPNKLRRRGLVFPVSETSIDFKRDLRKLGLRLFRPRFHALQHVFEYLGGHARYFITLRDFPRVFIRAISVVF